jgi:hypothetical protein
MVLRGTLPGSNPFAGSDRGRNGWPALVDAEKTARNIVIIAIREWFNCPSGAIAHGLIGIAAAFL